MDNMKNTHLLYIVFQVLKGLLVKRYKIQLSVLLFFVALHQLTSADTYDLLQLFRELDSKVPEKRFLSQIFLF